MERNIGNGNQMDGTQPDHDGLGLALVKLGMFVHEQLPEPVPTSMLAELCTQHGFRYYADGETFKVKVGWPVVAIYHYGGNIDSATYQMIEEIDTDRLSGLIASNDAIAA